jgi:hypothetical protein
MNIQMIPLSQLISSPANVGTTGANIGIGELAASIEAHGLWQKPGRPTRPKREIRSCGRCPRARRSQSLGQAKGAGR